MGLAADHRHLAAILRDDSPTGSLHNALQTPVHGFLPLAPRRPVAAASAAGRSTPLLWHVTRMILLAWWRSTPEIAGAQAFADAGGKVVALPLFGAVEAVRFVFRWLAPV